MNCPNAFNRRTTSLRSGTTLAEVIISTILIGVMVVASMRTVTATRVSQRLTADYTLGPGLAQELLSEVLAQSYTDPESPSEPLGPDASEPSREFFDDVDDYSGYSSAAVNRVGTSLDGYAGWQLDVEVDWVNHNLKPMNQDRGLKLIVVTVTSPDGEETSLTGLRFHEGMFEQPPTVDTEAVVWLGAALRVGNAPAASRTGVPLPNLLATPRTNP